MDINEKIKNLLDEIRHLAREDRNDLIDHLVSEKRKEDRSPDEVETLSDGTVRETYWVRPEEMRRIHSDRYELFMGQIKFSYFPLFDWREYRERVIKEWEK